jgi:hypothetical protein
MAKQTPTTLELFRSFCQQNGVVDLEQSLLYFTVFGGLGWDVAMDEDLDVLIDELILDNYDSLHKDITEETHADAELHALLTGVARGDGRSFSAYKRARLSREEGVDALKTLLEKKILREELPRSKSYLDADAIPSRLHFNLPFVRFWFAFVSPLFKGIKEGDFEEFHTKFENHIQEFLAYTYEELFKEVVKASFSEDTIVEIGGFWNKDIDIELYAKTTSGKIIVGSVRYANTKSKKSELSKLQEKCEQANIKPDIYALFSKAGFSNELKGLKGSNLKLYGMKHIQALLK